MLKIIKALKNNHGFKKYFFNTSWLFAEQILRILSGLFVGIWVARYLGPEQFGIFSYALAFAAIFGGIAKLGLDGIVVRELINHPEKRDIYLGTTFWLKVMGAFLVMGLMSAIIPFTSNNPTTNLYIFIIAAGLVFQSFEVVEFYFQSLVLAKIISICKVVQLGLSSIIKIYLVLTQSELIWFVIVTTFDALTLSFSYLMAYRLRKNEDFYNYFNFEIAKKLLRNSWPLIITGMSVILFMQVDKLMIKHMIGEFEVGVYAAGVKFPEAVYFIPMLSASSLFPAILNAKTHSLTFYHDRLQKFYFFMTWSGIIIFISLAVMSKYLVSLYGSAFESAQVVLIIYSFSLVFLFQWIARGRWVLAENLQSLTFYYMSLGAIINIILNLFFIRWKGIVGAAIATVITQFLITLVIPLFYKNMRASTWMLYRSYFTWKNL